VNCLGDLNRICDYRILRNFTRKGITPANGGGAALASLPTAGLLRFS
jgi:hypothetical protein